MTNTTIKLRILRAQADELRRIRQEIQASPQPNMVELIAVLSEAHDDIRTALVALDRAAGMTGERSD